MTAGEEVDSSHHMLEGKVAQSLRKGLPTVTSVFPIALSSTTLGIVVLM